MSREPSRPWKTLVRRPGRPQVVTGACTGAGGYADGDRRGGSRAALLHGHSGSCCRAYARSAPRGEMSRRTAARVRDDRRRAGVERRMRHSRIVMSAGIVDSTTSTVCASIASDSGEEVMRGVFCRADAVASGRVPSVGPWSPAVGLASCPGRSEEGGAPEAGRIGGGESDRASGPGRRGPDRGPRTCSPAPARREVVAALSTARVAAERRAQNEPDAVRCEKRRRLSAGRRPR